MYITPNGTIQLINNIALTPNYEHTIYFGSGAARDAYFSQKVVATFSGGTYTRVNKSVVRVPVAADSIYNVTYLRFNNSGFSSRWFYAFVTGVEFVNPETTQISFQIDVIQTWFFTDCTLKPCLVEREHTESDEIGEHILPEPVELGEYIVGSYSRLNAMENPTLVFVCNFDENSWDWYLGGYGFATDAYNHTRGYWYGLKYVRFPATAAGFQQAGTFIQNAITNNKYNGIKAMYMAPTDSLYSASTFTVNKPARLANYTPKNKKLLTYPYNMLYVTNSQGSSAVYKYENFSGSNCDFENIQTCQINPVSILSPKMYAGVAVNTDESIYAGGYPQCTCNADSFDIYLANLTSWQNICKTSLQPITNALMNFGTGILSKGNIQSAAVSAFADYEHDKSQRYSNAAYGLLDTTLQPPQQAGAITNPALYLGGFIGFLCCQKSVKKEVAEKIDDFFTRYGYRVNTLKTPNISARPAFNYTKTNGCVIKGSCPADDLATICRIFDSGITFWKNGDNIGDFSLDNSV